MSDTIIQTHNLTRYFGRKCAVRDLNLIGTALACAVTTKDYGSMTYWLLGMQPATTACAAIGGLGLGVLQFIFEARRDRHVAGPGRRVRRYCPDQSSARRR